MSAVIRLVDLFNDGDVGPKLFDYLLAFACGESLCFIARLSQVSRDFSVLVGQSAWVRRALRSRRLIGWFRPDTIYERDISSDSDDSSSGSEEHIPQRNRRGRPPHSALRKWVGDTDLRYFLAHFGFSRITVRLLCAFDDEASEEDALTAPEQLVARPLSKRNGAPTVQGMFCGHRCVAFNDITRAPKKFWDNIIDEEPEHPLCHLRTQRLDEPVGQPVTIFCVALTSEDSTLFSGHSNRFELAHGAYTDSPHIALTAFQSDDDLSSDDASSTSYESSTSTRDSRDRSRSSSDREAASKHPTAAALEYPQAAAEPKAVPEHSTQEPALPVAVATFPVTEQTLPVELPSAGALEHTPPAGPELPPVLPETVPADDPDEGTDKSRSRKGRGSATPSTVSTSPTSSSESSFSTEEEVPLTELLQGETLPGRWHVYKGVFDGYRSSVAVDGGVEKVTEYACAHGREPRNGGGGAGDGLLDGLSLGTDHFQLNDDSDDDESERPTKSYRQRSDTSDSSSDDDSSTEAGDDEFGCRGAMSEVVVVGGRLSDADIAFFERYVLRQLLLNSSCVRHLVVTVRVNICIQVFAGET